MPRAADKMVHLLAPVVLLIPVLLTYAVLPFGKNMVLANYDAGLLFFLAVGGAVEVAVFMAGWSSRNKYSLLGAMRAIAQMLSYEIPLILSAVTVVMMVGSLNLSDIVRHQNQYTFGLAHWHVFTPWGLVGFLLFFVASLAESNRTPFDLPEAESEIIAGYFTEYSGFKFALFFLGEYLGMFAITGLGVTLFLGGWTAPFSFLTWIPSYVWFLAQAAGHCLCLHLDSRHAAALAHGSTDELGVEVHAAAGAHQYRGRRHLAFHGTGLAALAGL